MTIFLLFFVFRNVLFSVFVVFYVEKASAVRFIRELLALTIPLYTNRCRFYLHDVTKQLHYHT